MAAAARCPSVSARCRVYLFKECHNEPMKQADQETAGGVILVITRKVLPGSETAYEQWVRKVSDVERSVPGFISREDIPPLPEGQDWHTTVLRFESRELLDAWTESESLKGLLDEVEPLCCNVARSQIEPGFFGWFPESESPGHSGPPTWKMTMSVVLALYPSVFLITLLITNGLDLPFPLKLLIGNILAVSCVSWISMPLCRRLLGSWLAPASACPIRTSVLGAIGITAILLVLLWIFMQIPMG